MALRIFGTLVLIAALATGALLLTMGNEKPVVSAPPVSLVPEVPTLDDELNNRFIERFIAEDEDIQGALTGKIKVSDATGGAIVEDEAEVKTNSDVLYELMAPWVYVRYRSLNDVRGARFLNTNSNRKSPWLSTGGILNGAQIIDIDMEKATVQYADATQELTYVSETPPPLDPTVPRTPEQVAEAQKRYKEFYYKKFVVSGKKYAALRGKKSNAEVPAPRVQEEKKLEYLEYAETFAAKSGGAQMPPEALIDPEQLDPEQRAVYENYRSLFQRQPESVQHLIDQERVDTEAQLMDLTEPDEAAAQEPAAETGN